MAVNKVVMNTANGAETLIDLTGDTVKKWHLPSGITAHSADGEQITGTVMTFDEEQTYTPGVDDISPNPSGMQPVYFRYGLTIEGDQNLVPENIKSGVSIFGVGGTFEGTTEIVPGEAPDDIFAIKYSLQGSYVEEMFCFTEYVPFKSGMTWREFFDSYINGYISNSNYAENSLMPRVHDSEGDFSGTPSYYHILTDGYVSLTKSFIKDANGDYVGWDDVIQSFVYGGDSAIYNCFW